MAEKKIILILTIVKMKTFIIINYFHTFNICTISKI
jgi:hypothetical protein